MYERLGVNRAQRTSPELTPIDYCIWGMKDTVYEMKVGTREELLVRIMKAAAIIKISPDKLRCDALRSYPCDKMLGSRVRHLWKSDDKLR